MVIGEEDALEVIADEAPCFGVVGSLMNSPGKPLRLSPYIATDGLSRNFSGMRSS